MQRQKIDADDHTAYYVVNLLTIFSRTEALFDVTSDGVEFRPVALILADSVDAQRPEERNHALQRVGDVSLFLAGFLGDGFARKLVDVDYYVQMGGAAYGTLSTNVRGSTRSRALAGVFEELARKFQDFVDVLTDIREQDGSRQTDVLRQYEIWLKTGSKRAARALRDAGIEPNDASMLLTRH